MKKLSMLLLVLLSVCVFTSCKKNCSCTEVVKSNDTTGVWDGMDLGGTATYTKEVKGDCSDLNAVSEVNNMGMVLTTTVTCVEE